MPQNESAPSRASDLVDLPNLAVDPQSIDLGFEVGFRATDDEENPFDVSPEILRRNRETLNYWARIWLRQSSMLAPFILQDFKVDPVTSVSDEDRNVDQATCEAERKDSAVIVATGPSLEKHLEALCKYKGIIIAAPTALSVLLANGIRPHYCVAVDANGDVGAILADAPYASWGVKLLVPPTCDFKSAAAFEGSRFWFKSLILARTGLNHPFNLYMTLLYPWIENWIYQAGCVTNAAFLLCTILNARGRHDIRKVFLLGADFGYPEGLPRVQAYKYVPGAGSNGSGSGRWLIQPREPLRFRTARLTMLEASNGILTDNAMLGYKRSLYSIWQMNSCVPFRVSPELGDASPIAYRPCLYSASEGILFELPVVDADATLEASGDNVELYTQDLINDIFKRYMRTTGKAEGQIRPDLEVPD